MSRPSANGEDSQRLMGEAGAIIVPDLQAISSLETEVMDQFWNGEPRALAVVDVYRALLGPERWIAQETVKSTMKRLVDKGLLLKDEARPGQATYYRASVTRDQYEERVVVQVLLHLHRLCPKAVNAAMARLRSSG